MGGPRLSIGGSSSVRSDVVCAIDREADWPFGRVNSLDRDDLRETAYELFFTSCRASPGFGGGRNPLTYYPEAHAPTAAGDGPKPGLGLVGASRIKRALGLRPAAQRRGSPRRVVNRTFAATGDGSGSPNSVVGRPKRPMTSAELMRQQMRVTEQSDNRLRKTLMRTLVGQMGRRAETIVLPLELLRQLKPSEFNDAHEYHLWQKRQLKILEAGLVLHPSVPFDHRPNPHVARLRDIVRASEIKAIDTNKNSDSMKTLCTSVVALAWRTQQSEMCHWADGFPLNIHLYLSLLQSIFDVRDETLVLDEVDELVELMKKTWSMLGVNRALHNLCLAWVLFQQFVTTGQAEQDLLGASLAMLAEVANDAKKGEREAAYVKVLGSTMASMQAWAEKSMLDYHECFEKGGAGLMENVLPLALSTAKILGEDVGRVLSGEREPLEPVDPVECRVDYYIRSSLRNAFTKVLETADSDGETEECTSESLVALAKDTEELGLREKEMFSHILKRWHPMSAAVAAVTLHNCYGAVLKQYLSEVTTLTNDIIQVLNVAGKLEKVLVQMVVEDTVDCDDGGKSIVREMVPFEIESITLSLIKTWIDESLKRARECLNRAKDTETWNAKSKTEPHAQSVVELINLAKETVEDFFEIPVNMRDDLVQVLADGWEAIVQEYTSFVASCGSKQSYIPTLPPLTRCNQDSKFRRLWRLAALCKAGSSEGITQSGGPCTYHNHRHHNHHRDDGPRPSTSRGTHRIYVRLNTLHYLLTHLHPLDKTLCLSHHLQHLNHPHPSPRFPNSHRRRISSSTTVSTTTTSTSTTASTSSSYFDTARTSIQTAIQQVSEVAAYRLIFLDSNHTFYETLYLGDVANSRIYPALRMLKQNLTLLISMLTDKSQSLAVKEVMKASFEAFLMVLLAGGRERAFAKSDYEVVMEDFGSLKKVFATCGEGLVAEEVVEREAEVAEGVVGLMGLETEQLIEDLSTVACEASGLGMGQKVPMPPTTGRWNRADPNTILRVLCHRNDVVTDRFLKKTFQLAKRR
ncbi:hypothetical protein QJS04_geneDACA000034 [Acorus gramineus]|uniref:Uncharacterized protein n=1 Tax=Acorus gramineus TaxID=55184 RepID=A0AAV9ASR6_ACOGR|nr:hypothetical protein QJS04_geneDACA000034 [Acorus gramineus]